MELSITNGKIVIVSTSCFAIAIRYFIVMLKQANDMLLLMAVRQKLRLANASETAPRRRQLRCRFGQFCVRLPV